MQRFVLPINSPEATDAERFGPKAANLARLEQAGLPTPGGFSLDAAAYRRQIQVLGLEHDARAVFGSPDSAHARRHALAMKLGILDQPITPEVLDELLDAWREMSREGPLAVRSSALVEDRFGSSFAGQFESFLGIETEQDFITAVRSCWGALWATRALRYMADHEIDPATTAMAVLVQPLVQAIASGGGLSQSHDGTMVLSAIRGLGAPLAQGEITPDRYELDRKGNLLNITRGVTEPWSGCIHRVRSRRSEFDLEPCLDETKAIELGSLMLRVEFLLGMPVEIEWAMDQSGVKLLQARPLMVQPATLPDPDWMDRPRLNGHPAGVGWATGRACVIACECELGRVAPGDVLVTRSGSPALSHILPILAGLVAERGGSTSHLASLARERGIPMVLGVPSATARIPNGSTVAVDGIAGVVRWA